MAWFFEVHDAEVGEVLSPTADAGSGWGSATMRGMAVGGALARAVERSVTELGRSDLTPVRWTLDLFRGAHLVESVARTRIVREGRRLCLVEADLSQAGRAVARGTALFLATGETPEGVVWSPAHDHLFMPPPELAPADEESRFYYSEGMGWHRDGSVHRSAMRKQSWHQPVSIVKDEVASPFQWVASVADAANVVVNWGDSGLEYINADVTLNIARLPHGDEVGLSVIDRVDHGGIAVGVATVFDRLGALGSITVSALGNAAHAVDPAIQGQSG